MKVKLYYILKDSYDSECFRKTLLAYKGQSYQQKSCQRMCNQKNYGLNCKCSYPNRPIYFDNENMRICDLSGPDHECIEKTLRNSKLYFKDCDCPLECETTSYSYTNSIAQYPSLWHYENNLKNFSVIQNLSFQEVRESVAKVQIGYSQMEQTIITEEKKIEFNDLVSNLGGTLGLFLGFSFLTLVEFIEIILQAILILINKNQRIKDQE